MKFRISKTITVVSAAALALIVVAVVATIQHNTSLGLVANERKQSTDAKLSDAVAGNTTENKLSGSSDNVTSDPGNHTVNAAKNNDAAPVAPACKLLSSVVAKQVLGVDVKISVANGSIVPETANTTVSACAYSGVTDTVQLAVREPKDSLGVSENAVIFGSERPAGVTSVKGYGQSAYWSPDSKHLNILGSNKWYIITSSAGTQAAAEAVAKVLVSEF